MRPKNNNKKPNIVLIVCDTLGAKHVSLYGYGRATTPGLERLAREDKFTVYTRCFAPAPWTVPSHASLFTGLYPSEHKCDGSNFTLSKELGLLPDILRAVGYRTIGISSNSLISSYFGYSRGFDSFYEMWNLFNEEKDEGRILQKFSGVNKSNKPILLLKDLLSGRNFTATSRVCINMLYRRFQSVLLNSMYATEKTARLTERIIKNQQKAGQPLFLFINFMQTHDKYNPPHLFRNVFVRDNQKFDRKHRWEDEYAHYTGNLYHEDFLHYLEGLYDQEVLYLDSVLYRIVQTLKLTSSLDDTFVIITSDHGELFGEHNHIHHLFSVYNELIHVPLLIRHPDNAATMKDERLVQLHDLYSTLLDMVDAPFPRPSSSNSLFDENERKFAISQLINTDFKIAACNKKKPGFYPIWDDHRLDKSEMAIITLKNGQWWKYVKTEDGKERLHDLYKDFAESTDETATDQKRLMAFRELFLHLSMLTGYEQI